MEKEVQTDVTKNIENIEIQRIEPTQLEVVQNDALTIEEIETGLVYNGSMVRVADISGRIPESHRADFKNVQCGNECDNGAD